MAPHPAPETATLPLLSTRELLPAEPSYLQLASRMAGRVALRLGMPVAGAYAGLFMALNGAHSEANIGGMPVDAVTSVGVTPGSLSANVQLEDSRFPTTEYTTTNFGSIHFPDFLGALPVSVDVHARPSANTVEAAIGGRYEYALSTIAEAEEKSKTAIHYFERQAAIGLGGGLLAGAAASELAALGYRRLRREPTSRITPRTPHAARVGIGYSTIALAMLGSTGGLVASHMHPNLSHYEADGMIGIALHAPQGLAHIDLKNEVLNSIFYDFQVKNACPSTDEFTRKPANALTVTTYNIKSGSFGIDHVADELRPAHSDIILLQEVKPDVLDALSKSLGMQAVSGWTINTSELVYGNAILVSPNLPIISSRIDQLPSKGVEPRLVLSAKLRTPSGHTLVIADTHLTNERPTMQGDRNQPLRRAQAVAATHILKELGATGDAVIFGGDMNQGTNSAVYDAFTAELKDTLATKPEVLKADTLPGNGQHFDDILTPTSWPTIHATRGGGSASDHCLVSVVLQMQGPYAVPTSMLAEQALPAEKPPLPAPSSAARPTN